MKLAIGNYYDRLELWFIEGDRLFVINNEGYVEDCINFQDYNFL